MSSQASNATTNATAQQSSLLLQPQTLPPVDIQVLQQELETEKAKDIWGTSSKITRKIVALERQLKEKLAGNGDNIGSQRSGGTVDRASLSNRVSSRFDQLITENLKELATDIPSTVATTTATTTTTTTTSSKDSDEMVYHKKKKHKKNEVPQTPPAPPPSSKSDVSKKKHKRVIESSSSSSSSDSEEESDDESSSSQEEDLLKDVLVDAKDKPRHTSEQIAKHQSLVTDDMLLEYENRFRSDSKTKKSTLDGVANNSSNSSDDDDDEDEYDESDSIDSDDSIHDFIAYSDDEKSSSSSEDDDNDDDDDDEQLESDPSYDTSSTKKHNDNDQDSSDYERIFSSSLSKSMNEKQAEITSKFKDQLVTYLKYAVLCKICTGYEDMIHQNRDRYPLIMEAMAEINLLAKKVAHVAGDYLDRSTCSQNSFDKPTALRVQGYITAMIRLKNLKSTKIESGGGIEDSITLQKPTLGEFYKMEFTCNSGGGGGGGSDAFTTPDDVGVFYCGKEWRDFFVCLAFLFRANDAIMQIIVRRIRECIQTKRYLAIPIGDWRAKTDYILGNKEQLVQRVITEWRNVIQYFYNDFIQDPHYRQQLIDQISIDLFIRDPKQQPTTTSTIASDTIVVLPKRTDINNNNQTSGKGNRGGGGGGSNNETNGNTHKIRVY